MEWKGNVARKESESVSCEYSLQTIVRYNTDSFTCIFYTSDIDIWGKSKIVNITTGLG